MTPDEFSAAIRRVEDVDALRLGIDWVTTLEAGGTIPRAEVEQQFPLLLSPLMQLKPLDTTTVRVASQGQVQNVAGQTAQQESVKAETIVAATPAYRQEQPGNDEIFYHQRGWLRGNQHLPTQCQRPEPRLVTRWEDNYF